MMMISLGIAFYQALPIAEQPSKYQTDLRLAIFGSIACLFDKLQFARA